MSTIKNDETETFYDSIKPKLKLDNENLNEITIVKIKKLVN